MKKLLLIALLMLALVITAVACTDDPTPPETSADDVTTVENPTEAPDEPETPAPDTQEPETPAPDTQEPETPAPDTDEPETPKPEVPTQEPETDPPVDPADPVWIIDAEGLSSSAAGGNGVSATLDEGGFVHLTATNADPYFQFASNLGTMPDYLAIRYRTNTSNQGEMFIGSGAGPAAGASFIFHYEGDEDWNLLVFYLPDCVSSIQDGVIGHIRLDFFNAVTEGDYMDIEYVAFFNTAEYALAYDFELHPPYLTPNAAGVVDNAFDTFYVNGGMYFPEDGGASDKLAAQNNTITFAAGEAHDSMMLRGWIGFSQPIVSFGYYIDNYDFMYGEFAAATEDGVKTAGGEHASRFEILVPLSELTGGVHTAGFVVKLEDGTVVRLRDELTVIIIPETVDEAVSLATGHGAPFSGAPSNYFGQRYNIGENLLKKVSITDMATYSDGDTNTWSFKVWQWDTDYATTVAGTPLFETEGENHPDNTTFNMDIPADKYITGDIYYEVNYLSGSGCFTGWTADNVTEGVETYVAGSIATGAYSASLVVGVPADGEAPEVTPDHQLQNPPVYIIKAKDMLMTNATQMNYEKMDGYVHFVPTGGDPNFMLFNGQTGSRYVSIKYRTEYQANIQIFLGSTGNAPVDDTTMMEQALIPDGEWHLAIFDTQTLVDRGVYDGSTASFLRLDVMESGYECDENGEPIRDPDGTWHKLPLPAGATIDIAYFAFFETEEKANAYEYAPVVTDKTVYNVGEPIMITANGAGKDWVGIAGINDTETIRWWYVETAGAGVAINALDNAAIQAGTGAATGDLPAGQYYVVWVPNDQAMDGAEGICRYPITIVDESALAQDSHNFQSNAAANIDAENPADVDFRQSDLAGLFSIIYGQGDTKPCYVKVDGFYQMSGFQSAHVAADGAYAFKAESFTMVDGGGFASMFVRGVKSASPEGQYYGSDGGDAGAKSHGGSGIYLTLEGSNLVITFKSYADGAFTHSKYSVAVDSADITVADDGSTVYILVGDKLAAKVEISGTRDFGIKNTAADALADKVVLTLADGSVQEIANAVVAAGYGDLGFATRGHGNLTFNNCSLMPFSTVEIPEAVEPETPALPKFTGSYHANIDHINAKGPAGAANYSGLGASVVNSNGTVPVRNAVEDEITVNADYTITIGGWMAVNGGINRYAYSVNGGELITAVGGVDGEPLADYYKNLGMPDSTKNGKFNGANCIVADLSAYAGETVSVTFYAIPEAAQDTVVPFLTVEELAVPVAETPAVES